MAEDGVEHDRVHGRVAERKCRAVTGFERQVPDPLGKSPGVMSSSGDGSMPRTRARD